MPRKYDLCVKSVQRNIRTGKMPKTYVKAGKRLPSNAYAICNKLRARGKKKGFFGWKLLKGFEL